MITQKRVKELFDYQDGLLIRKTSVRGTKVKKGDIAGHLRSRKYKSVGIDYSTYNVHQIVWLYHKGYFPENDIDHIDRDKGNNRIENLREVSNQCNMRNTANPSTNTSGVKGVYYNKDREKWLAHIKISLKTYNLGGYLCFTEAVAHRLCAEQCVDWSSCDVSSPAYKYMQKFLKANHE